MAFSYIKMNDVVRIHSLKLNHNNFKIGRRTKNMLRSSINILLQHITPKRENHNTSTMIYFSLTRSILFSVIRHYILLVACEHHDHEIIF